MQLDILSSNVKDKFVELYSEQPLIINGPGRINLIGEHTDYNDGFVLPAAIDKSIVFAMAENDIGIHRFYSIDFDEYHESSNISMNAERPLWAKYLIGVITQFLKKGKFIKGIDCVFGGNIPIGAGLSSSAALECGFAFGINNIFKTDLNDYQLVKMSQKAEHEYAGVMCGIMDQFASIYGKKDQVFRLDCRTNEHQYFNFPMDEYLIALVDTNVKHQLASSEYNIRRQECEAGVKYMHRVDASINSLRDLSLDLLEANKDSLDSSIYKRSHYVISENLRVLEATKALEQEDLVRFGDLMYESHNGLKNEFQVSCEELDMLVDITKDLDYVIGSRMMGGGFGGCTINLVKRTSIEEFESKIIKEYKKLSNKEASVYFVNISDGVSKLEK